MAPLRATLALALLVPLAFAGCSSDGGGSDDDGGQPVGGGQGDGGGGGGGSGTEGMPDIDVGDHWTFRATSGGVEVTTTTEVKASEDHGGVPAWRLEGTTTSSALGSTSTSDTTTWVRRSDMATLESHVATHITYSGTTQDQESTTVFDPPCVSYAWPLAVGKTWTSECKSTTTSGATSSKATTTTTYTVEATEQVTVAAGTFDAFRIKASSQDTTTTQYVALEACGPVRTTSDAYGAQSGVSMDLHSYEC